MAKKPKQTFKYLENDRALKVKQKAFFIIFKELSVSKNHTREKGGANLRISVWHLLMKFKNNYLLKKMLKWAMKM